MASRWTVVLGVAGVVLASLSLIGPWWVMTGYGQSGPVATWQYGIFGGTFTGPSVNLPSGQVSTTSSNYSNLPALGSLFLASALVQAMGIAVGMGTVAAVYSSNTRPRLRATALALCLLAFALVLGATLAVVVDLPGIANQYWGENALVFSGFWGSNPNGSRYGGLLTWGAGWGWYLSAAAAAVFMALTIRVVLEWKPGPLGVGGNANDHSST